MSQPVENLLLFALAALVAYALFSPRFGLFHKISFRKREIDRIRLEDSLKHICNQEMSRASATLSTLASSAEMDTTRALALVDRMSQANLINVVDGGLMLTDQGRRYALQIIRAHRLWERYLADETGVEPTQWHAMAHQREHALTIEETDALSERLGNPRFDPHGDPIPTKSGELPKESHLPLTQLEAGENARVMHIEDEPDAVYSQLVALGIYPGMELLLEVKTGERLIIEAEGRKLVIAPLVADNLSVKKISKQDRELADQEQESLRSLRPGETAEVLRISRACRGLERRRLMDLGILPGTRIDFDRRGLTGGLTSYRIRGTVIALREEQTDLISIHNQNRVTA